MGVGELKNSQRFPASIGVLPPRFAKGAADSTFGVSVNASELYVIWHMQRRLDPWNADISEHALDVVASFEESDPQMHIM